MTRVYNAEMNIASTRAIIRMDHSRASLKWPRTWLNRVPGDPVNEFRATLWDQQIKGQFTIKLIGLQGQEHLSILRSNEKGSEREPRLLEYSFGMAQRLASSGFIEMEVFVAPQDTGSYRAFSLVANGLEAMTRHNIDKVRWHLPAEIALEFKTPQKP